MADSKSGDIVQRRFVQYQALAFVPFVAPAAEVVTLDKWATQSPVPSRRSRELPTHPVFVFAPALPIDWLWSYPAPPRLRRGSTLPVLGPIFVEVLPLDWLTAPLAPRPLRDYPNTLSIHVEVVAPEVVTLDKWLTDSPICKALRRIPEVYPIWRILTDVVTMDKWYQAYPILPRSAPRTQHPAQAFLRIDVVPEVVTFDKWQTDSPAHYFRIPTQHIDFTMLDIFPEPPIPPEPPEPPIPPVETKKPGLHVNVRHLRRPPGGFNTIYYVGDDDE